MGTKVLVPALAVILATPLASAAGKSESYSDRDVMTNIDVLDLVKAGISEEVILTKIAASHVEFDTSTDAILRLKKAGVPESVISAMILRENGEPPARSDGESARIPPYAGIGSPLPVRLKTAAGTQTLKGTLPRDRYVNAVVAMLWFKRMKGEESQVQIDDNRPTLVVPKSVGGVNTNLSGTFFIKFDIDHDDEVRDFRIDWGTPFKFVTDMTPDEDYLVKYDAVENGSDIEITPAKALKKGCYGLMDERGYIYDFDVR
ncbi:MAG: hypothetical protein U0167_00185 [bacterium]